MSFVGLAPFDMNMLFVALPAVAAAFSLALLARVSLGVLLLPRPVLAATAEGIMDRRVLSEPLRWSEVTRAVSIVAGGGGIVFELRHPVPTFGMGSLTFEQPEPGVAHIALRGLDAPAPRLAAAILELAAASGVEIAEARGHDRLPRRNWSV
jgi:hypothetical protein